jgi:hypothetical protein
MKQLFPSLILACAFVGHVPAQPFASSDTGASTFSAAARAARGVPAGAAVSRLDAANKGVQFAPDGSSILVTKDIGAERWAIVLDERDVLTGNVFRCDGGKASFLWCEKVADDGNPDFPNRIAAWDCFGADACAATPCDLDAEWVLIGENVELRGSFFLP